MLTPRVLAAHGRPTGQGFTVGGLPTRRGGVDVVEVGRLDGARRRRRWLVVAPVSFYSTDEGRRSLCTSQKKKNDTRGGAHRRGRGGGAPARFRCGEGAPVAGDGE
jgi:hypothetical protein